MRERAGSSVFEYRNTGGAFMAASVGAGFLALFSIGALLVWTAKRTDIAFLVWAAVYCAGAVACAGMAYRNRLRSRPLRVNDDGVFRLARDRSVVTPMRWRQITKVEQRRYFSLISLRPEFVVEVTDRTGKRLVFRSSIIGAQALVAQLNAKIAALDIPVRFVNGRFGTARTVSQLAETP